MLIDLHCHTKKIKSGDAVTRNVQVEKFLEKVTDANVKIVAITNHNHFDLDQYNEFKKATKGVCDIWPGIELDIKGHNKRYHLIVIANPKSVDEFHTNVCQLIGDISPEHLLVELKEVFQKLDQCDVLYIPHFHKEPKISKKDIEELESLIDDKSRLFKETSDYRSLGVFSNFDYSVIIGSDNHEWDNYQNSKFADIRLPVQSFEQFCLLAKKDKVIIDTLLNKKNCMRVEVSPHESVKLAIPIYQDVNIIFGQKGTGKSEMINSLARYYDGMNINYQHYIGSEKDIGFKKLLSIKEMKPLPEKLSLGRLDNTFKNINVWKDKKLTNLNKYINWIETKDNNKNKTLMKITDAVLIEEFKGNAQLKRDYEIIIDLLSKKIGKLSFKDYLAEQEAEDLVFLLNKLIKRISEKNFLEWCEANAVDLSNWSIDKIKSIADMCSDTVSKPSTTGFREFAIERFKLFENANEICEALKENEHHSDEYLGLIDEKGSVFIRSRQRILCNLSRTDEFSFGINDLKKMKSSINNIISLIAREDLYEALNTYNELYEKGLNDISKFIGLSRETVLEDGSSYLPSSGERGILVLQKTLSTNADVYLLDEPELGMGNSYVNASILPQIINHAKNKRTVVVATHNANIAVRTLPYTSVLRTHQNGKYYTYLGNPFLDDLVNIDDDSDTKNWTHESMHTLEGGSNAFYERKDIYESGNE